MEIANNTLADRLIHDRLIHEMNNCLMIIGQTCELAKIRNDAAFSLKSFGDIALIAKRIEIAMTALSDLQFGHPGKPERCDVTGKLAEVRRVIMNSSVVGLNISLIQPAARVCLECDSLFLERLLTHLFLGFWGEGAASVTVRWEMPSSSHAKNYGMLSFEAQKAGQAELELPDSVDFEAAQKWADRLGFGFDWLQERESIRVELKLPAEESEESTL